MCSVKVCYVDFCCYLVVLLLCSVVDVNCVLLVLCRLLLLFFLLYKCWLCSVSLFCRLLLLSLCSVVEVLVLFCCGNLRCLL